MRKTLSIGVGVGVAALAATTAAGVASAATSGHAQASARSVAAVAAVNKHITRAQAGRIAVAKVPHSRIHEIESDDLHDRAVWKVQLSTPKGRVTVDVDKKTGKATIVRRGGGGGHGDAIAAITMARPGHDARDNDAADDRGQDVRDNDAADDRGQDARDNDGAGDRDQHGDRHGRGDGHDRDGGHDHDGGDDGPGR